jgi:type II restriction enzyme
MTSSVISGDALDRRAYWISEIVRISGDFGQDSARVERELSEEIASSGNGSLLDHLRLCGAIPEAYRHDSSEEKLYSKYTDIVLAMAFKALGLKAAVLVERADVADVEVVADAYSFVADAKVFRLSRTAKNQKDFKVQAMDGWKWGKPYAVVVCPLYQLPSKSSQIYQQAAARNVCVLSYSHLAVLVSYADNSSQSAAERVLHDVLQCVESLHPSKDAVAYWTAVNRTFLAADSGMSDLWRTEKLASAESLAAAKAEGLRFLAEEREAILRLTHDEAIVRLLNAHKLDSRAAVITGIRESGLLDLS